MVVFEASQAGGGAALGINANTVTPLLKGVKSRRAFREARRTRFTRRVVSSKWLIAETIGEHGSEHFAELAPRPATCGWAAGSYVGVHRGVDSPARFSGVQSCASVWSCACCGSVIRSRRATEVQTASDWWEKQGGQFLFLTLTVRHHLEDSLERTMDGLTDGFTALINGAPWKRFARVHGIEHFVKAQEVTLSWDHGWHAHLHVLLFVDLAGAVENLRADAKQAWQAVEENPTSRGLPNRARVAKAQRLDQAVEDAETAARQGIGTERKREIHDWLATRWAEKVVAAGGRRPDHEHGTDIRTVRDGNVVALYISKLQEADDYEQSGWQIGHEMARQDYKKGRKESLVPLELLDLDGLDDDAKERNRLFWLEYVATTHGRRSMTWSRGLKEAAGIVERDDDEVMAEDAAEVLEDDRVIVIDKRHWRAIRDDADVLARILELVEADRLDEIARYVPFEYPTSAGAQVPLAPAKCEMRVTPGAWDRVKTTAALRERTRAAIIAHPVPARCAGADS